MRIVRLFGVVLTILSAGLLLATPAGAQPPFKLTDHVTDTAAVLTDSDRDLIGARVDELYRDRHIQLWVAYVDNFSRFKPENWVDQTRSASRMGDHDALLVVATNTKLFMFSPQPKAQGLTSAELDDLRNKQIAPAVAVKDWSRAAVAAADGLEKSTNPPAKRNWISIAIAGAVVVAVLVLLFLLYRRRRRRRAAQRVHAGNGQLSIDSLDQALSTADARLRQISDYVAKHRASIGAEAQNRLEETRRYLVAARSTEATNPSEAIAYANGASRLAAEAQAMANADVLAAHSAPRRRGPAAKG